MFSNKTVISILIALVAACITLGTLLYISNQKVSSRDDTIANLNSNIDELNTKVNGLNLLVKQNDEIASKTISSLNNTILLCQQKQDEIITFCDKRVKLALESKEVDIAIEEVSSGDIFNEIDNKIKGIDQDSSISYIEELNKMIYGFGSK